MSIVSLAQGIQICFPRAVQQTGLCLHFPYYCLWWISVTVVASQQLPLSGSLVIAQLSTIGQTGVRGFRWCPWFYCHVSIRCQPIDKALFKGFTFWFSFFSSVIYLFNCSYMYRIAKRQHHFCSSRLYPPALNDMRLRFGYFDTRSKWLHGHTCEHSIPWFTYDIAEFFVASITFLSPCLYLKPGER